MKKERKSIFITGGASGMGRATARLFADNGWFVGLYDINEAGLEAVAIEIGAENCHTASLDVADLSAWPRIIDQFRERSGDRLDLLFNNAGIIRTGLFVDMEISDIERILKVNLMGVIYGIHTAYPLLAKTPNSLCFITSSSSAIFGAPGLAAYSASKHALKGLTEALSVEFSLTGIRAANAQPGHIITGMMDQEFKENLPKEGPWRAIPAEAVAKTVWASYHDTSGKLHWYVPEDLEDYQKRIAQDIESERDQRIEGFKARVKKEIEKNKTKKNNNA